MSAVPPGSLQQGRFSPEARAWLQGYSGSCDSTALLLAFDVGLAQVDELLASVHERIDGGIDLQTFADGTVEVRWRRVYRIGTDDREELSDERFTGAPPVRSRLVIRRY